MPETASPISQSSLLIWLLATVTAGLAVHVGTGWVRRAQGHPVLRQSWREVLVAAVAIGLGLSASMVLALTAATMGFPLGYRGWLVPALLAGGVLVAVPVMGALAFCERWWTLALCGVALALLVTALQACWLLAAGFVPGLFWHMELVAIAATVVSIACAAGLWGSMSPHARESKNRRAWLIGAATLAALGIAAGQEIMMAAAGLSEQVGSIYLRQVPGSLLSLVCALAPLALALLAMDLHLRRQRRRKHSQLSERFAPQRRRRRSPKVRSL